MDLKYYKRHYCSDIENVENYQKALADNFKGWHCHHRLETHNSDGKRLEVDVSAAELIALRQYYDVSADELIFLTASEHSILHNKGKQRSEETRSKMSVSKKCKKFSEEHIEKLGEAHRGEKHYMYGKHHSEEVKRKISEALKGRPSPNKGIVFSEESKKKKSESNIGRHWYNNGKVNKFCYECPEGFVPGMLK